MKKLTHRPLLAVLTICLALFVPAQIAGQVVRTTGPRPLLRPVIVKVEIKGPGALYVAPVGGDIGFWTLGSGGAALVGKVPMQTNPPTIRSIQVAIGNAPGFEVPGVFLSENLTFSASLTLSFTGTLANPECKECTAFMPLKSEGSIKWIELFAGVTGQQPLDARFTALLNQQKQILRAAGNAQSGFNQLVDQFVAMQKSQLTEYVQSTEQSFNELKTQVTTTSADLVGFEARIRAADDDYRSDLDSAAAAQQTAPDPGLEFQLGFNCGKSKLLTAKADEFINSLKADTRDDNAGDNFDQRANQGKTTYDQQIASFENGAMNILDSIEPCLNSLFLKYNAIDENNAPTLPKVAQAASITSVDYEKLGNDIENWDFAVETKTDAWVRELEARFNKLDRLNPSQSMTNAGGQTGLLSAGSGTRQTQPTGSTAEQQIALAAVQKQSAPKSWLEMRQRAENLLAPVTAYLGSASTGPSPAGNVPFSYNTAVMQKVGQPASPCGSGKYLTLDLQAVSFIIGTPWNDQITGDAKINIILGLSGDDCINGKDGHDAIFGNGNDDEIYGGDGHDFIFGDTVGVLGNGKDRLFGGIGESYSVSAGAVTLGFDIGNFISGDGDADEIVGSGDNNPNDPNEKYGFADVIIGDGFAGSQSGPDKINSDGGIDFVFGQSGDDTITNPVAGAFKINGVRIACGSFLFGNDGNDQITGTNTPSGITLTPPGKSIGDVIAGGLGNDTIKSGDGDDFTFGDMLVAPSTGNDNIDAGDGADLVVAQQGDDKINGGASEDILIGNAGNDVISSDAGAFSLMIGGPGNDIMTGGPGMDLAIGGVGDDQMDTGGGVLDVLIGFDGNDRLNGEGDQDAIFGGNGDDVIRNGGGVIDLTFAGNGNDFVDGEAGIDIIFGQRNNGSGDRCGLKAQPGDYETLNGGDGSDVIWGGLGPDKISGGNGVDVLFGEECHDIITGDGDIDVVFAGAGDDSVSGGSAFDAIFGGTGEDALRGDAGPDVILGGDGRDDLGGGDGSDVLLGGLNDDKISGGNDPDLGFGGDGNDGIDGGDGIDALFGGENNDSIAGGNSSDIILGGNGDDTADGGDGSDVILGGDGNDGSLRGGSSADLIFGGIGADGIFGGIGSDLMFGGKDGDNIVDNDNSSSEINISFGGDGDDSIDTKVARNFVFGGDGTDGIDLKDNGNPDKRDFGWGGPGNDNFTTNSVNFTDWTF